MTARIPPPSYLFSYSSVLQRNRIRLVTIHPERSSPKAFIRMSLSSHHLHEAPPYEALSYEWGHSQDLVSVSIDQKIYYIRSNLQQALMRLRHTDRPRMIWVDAISINQKDQIEKSEQVSQMAAIYQHAVQTLMWIGEETESTEDYFGKMVSLAAAAYHTRSEPGYLKMLNSFVSVVDWLGGQRYFSRVWMTQEIVVSRVLVLKCGSFETPFTIPAAAIYLLSQKPGHQLSTYKSTNLARMYSLRAIYHASIQSRATLNQEGIAERAVIDLKTMLLALDLRSRGVAPRHFPFEPLCWYVENQLLNTSDVPVGGFSLAFIDHSWPVVEGEIMDEDNEDQYDRNIGDLELLDILIQERNKDASDPLDKVYATLNIAEADREAYWKPDYTKSIQEVYTDVAIQCLKSPKLGLRMLSCSQPSHSTLGLPSWIPDWSQPWHGGLFHRKDFAAGVSLVPRVTYDPSMKAITALGTAISVVTSVGGVDAKDLEAQYCEFDTIRDRLLPLVRKLGWTENDHSCDVLISLLTAGRNDAIVNGFDKRTIEIGCGVDIEINSPYNFHNMLWNRFLNELVWSRGRWDVFKTRRGDFGIGPASMQPGDRLCVLHGSKTPSILRLHGHGQYKFIGECYLPALMSGELMNWAINKKKTPQRSFTIL